MNYLLKLYFFYYSLKPRRVGPEMGLTLKPMENICTFTLLQPSFMWKDISKIISGYEIISSTG